MDDHEKKLTRRLRRRYKPRSYTPLYTDISADAVAFGRAMYRYMEEHRTINPTCPEILAVLCSLGYRKRSRETANVRDVASFTHALHAFKQATRPHQTWSEVLAVAVATGWKMPAPPPNLPQ